MSSRHRTGICLLALSCLLLTVGCQTRPAVGVPVAQFPQPITAWPLHDDSNLNWRISSEFTASYRQGTANRNFKALVTLARAGDNLHLIALSPLGIPLFTASLESSGKLTIEQQVQTPGFSPERVLAELQFCLWPEELLHATIPSPWSVEAQPSNRTLLRNGSVVATAQWPEAVNQLDLRSRAGIPVELRHREQGYEIRIRPLAPK